MATSVPRRCRLNRPTTFCAMRPWLAERFTRRSAQCQRPEPTMPQDKCVRILRFRFELRIADVFLTKGDQHIEREEIESF